MVRKKIEQVAFRLELNKGHSVLDSIIPWHGLENGKPISVVMELHVGFLRKFAIGFLRLLPIESQL